MPAVAPCPLAPPTQLVAEVVAAKTKAEEEGLEEDENEVGGGNEEDDIIAECEAAPGGVCARSARVQRQRLRRGAWRARVLVAAGGGEEPDEALVANALSYEGERISRRGGCCTRPTISHVPVGNAVVLRRWGCLVWGGP